MTGCQSKSITKAGKQWFGLDPSTKPIQNGVDQLVFMQKHNLQIQVEYTYISQKDLTKFLTKFLEWFQKITVQTVT